MGELKKEELLGKKVKVIGSTKLTSVLNPLGEGNLASDSLNKKNLII